MQNKVCLLFSKLSHYRRAIYRMIDQNYDCDWYVENRESDIKTFDDSELKSVNHLPVVKLGPFFWVKGQVSLLKKGYQLYFMLGSTRNMSLFVTLLLKNLFYRNKRIYLWTHGLYGKESRLELFLWKLPLLRMADGLFTYGDYSKKLLIEKGFDENKIFPIHNSLDYDTQLELRKKLKVTTVYKDYFGNDNPTILFIGRLTPVKKLNMLVNAIATLMKKGHHYNVVFVGDGTERGALEKLVDENGLSNAFWFYGECYDEGENAKLVYNADLCVAPGNIGLTAMHSLMFGCPAVSHDNFSMQMPEFEAITPGITGDFYQYGSTDGLSETISNWFENHQKDRDTVREACYKVIDTDWNPYYQMEVIRKNFK